MALSFGSCKKTGGDGDATAPGEGGAPAPAGSYADLAQRFERAARSPDGKEEAARLTGPLLDAASQRLGELATQHEVVREGDAAELRISSDRTSPLGRLAENLRAGGDTRLIYDVAHLRDRPDRRTGYDETANVLRMTHAVLLRGGDVEEPTLRHEQARAEAWAPYWRGEPTPYPVRLGGGAGASVYLDELHADARDVVRGLLAVSDALVSGDDAPLTQADFAAVLAARERGGPLKKSMSDLEARWDRTVAAALAGAARAEQLGPPIRKAQSLARGKPQAQFSPGPRGAIATLPVAVADKEAAGEYTLLTNLAESTGPDDPKNAALLRAQLTAAVEVVERHGEYFAAMVELLRKISATPAGKDRRAMLRALATVVEPPVEGAPPRAAYVKDFEQTLAGKPVKAAPKKKAR